MISNNLQRPKIAANLPAPRVSLTGTPQHSPPTEITIDIPIPPLIARHTNPPQHCSSPPNQTTSNTYLSTDIQSELETHEIITVSETFLLLTREFKIAYHACQLTVKIARALATQFQDTIAPLKTFFCNFAPSLEEIPLSYFKSQNEADIILYQKLDKHLTNWDRVLNAIKPSLRRYADEHSLSEIENQLSKSTEYIKKTTDKACSFSRTIHSRSRKSQHEQHTFISLILRISNQQPGEMLNNLCFELKKSSLEKTNLPPDIRSRTSHKSFNHSKSNKTGFTPTPTRLARKKDVLRAKAYLEQLATTLNVLKQQLESPYLHKISDITPRIIRSDKPMWYVRMNLQDAALHSRNYFLQHYIEFNEQLNQLDKSIQSQLALLDRSFQHPDSAFTYEKLEKLQESIECWQAFLILVEKSFLWMKTIVKENYFQALDSVLCNIARSRAGIRRDIGCGNIVPKNANHQDRACSDRELFETKEVFIKFENTIVTFQKQFCMEQMDASYYNNLLASINNGIKISRRSLYLVALFVLQQETLEKYTLLDGFSKSHHYSLAKTTLAKYNDIIAIYSDFVHEAQKHLQISNHADEVITIEPLDITPFNCGSNRDEPTSCKEDENQLFPS